MPDGPSTTTPRPGVRRATFRRGNALGATNVYVGTPDVLKTSSRSGSGTDATLLSRGRPRSGRLRNGQPSVEAIPRHALHAPVRRQRRSVHTKRALSHRLGSGFRRTHERPKPAKLGSA